MVILGYLVDYIGHQLKSKQLSMPVRDVIDLII